MKRLSCTLKIKKSRRERRGLHPIFSVKAVVESGVGATAISNLIIVKELRLDLLRPIQVTGLRSHTSAELLSRPFLLLKHRERFQPLISQAFEQLLATS